MSNERYELFNGRDNQYYFRLKAANGEIIGASEGYTSKQGARQGIESVRIHSPFDSRYTLFTGKDDRHYFNLKATNGEIILHSQGYATRQNALYGKEAVKRTAPSAPVVDLTTAVA